MTTIQAIPAAIRQQLRHRSAKPLLVGLAVGWLSALVPAAANAQSFDTAWDTSYRQTGYTIPQTQLRPLGSPSAVDRYRNDTVPPAGEVRQVVLMQPQLPAPPSGQMSTPPISGGYSLPAGPPVVSTPPAMDPPPTALPPSTGGATLTPVPRAAVGANDFAPLAQPQLGNQFASLGNCRNISAPSAYRSDRILTCGPPPGYVVPASQPQVYVPPPAQIGTTTGLVPPPIIPIPATAPGVQTVIPGNAGYRPLISFGQERYPVQIGQGLYGQPVAYVPGQSFRNALRYIAW